MPNSTEGWRHVRRPRPEPQCVLGFRIQSLGFRVQGWGLRVECVLASLTFFDLCGSFPKQGTPIYYNPYYGEPQKRYPEF